MPANEDLPPKIGQGHAEAMLRQGLKELRGALYPESNVAQQPEYGLYGTRTPGEVAESRRSESLDLEQEKSVLSERMREVSGREDQDRDTREMERG